MFVVVLLIMGLTYGVNVFLYYYVKKRPQIGSIESLAMWLGVNMTVLFFDGILLLIGILLTSKFSF